MRILGLNNVAGIQEEEKKRLLHCVVIGGGPTGVEFSGELSDFIMKDVRESYSHVKDHIRVTLIEVCLCLFLVMKTKQTVSINELVSINGSHILSTFDRQMKFCLHLMHL